jgi:hypothetical protein
MAQHRILESACFDFGEGYDYVYTHLATIQYSSYRSVDNGRLEYYTELWLVEITTEDEDESFDTITADKVINKVTDGDLVEAHARFKYRADELQHEIDSYSGV